MLLLYEFSLFCVFQNTKNWEPNAFSPFLLFLFLRTRKQFSNTGINHVFSFGFLVIGLVPNFENFS